jgi:hypothetical protein
LPGAAHPPYGLTLYARWLYSCARMSQNCVKRRFNFGEGAFCAASDIRQALLLLPADSGLLEGYLRVVRSRRNSEAPCPSTALKPTSDRFVFSDLYGGWRTLSKCVVPTLKLRESLRLPSDASLSSPTTPQHCTQTVRGLPSSGVLHYPAPRRREQRSAWPPYRVWPNTVVASRLLLTLAVFDRVR